MPVDDVTPFHLAVPDFELDDLRARLGATRWPEPATDPAQGVALKDCRRCTRTGPMGMTGEGWRPG